MTKLYRKWIILILGGDGKLGVRVHAPLVDGLAAAQHRRLPGEGEGERSTSGGPGELHFLRSGGGRKWPGSRSKWRAAMAAGALTVYLSDAMEGSMCTCVCAYKRMCTCAHLYICLHVDMYA